MAPSVAAQWVHVVAVVRVGGGLAALLLGIRGAPSDEKAAAVRRFSTVAAPALAAIVATACFGRSAAYRRGPSSA